MSSALVESLHDYFFVFFFLHQLRLLRSADGALAYLTELGAEHLVLGLKLVASVADLPTSIFVPSGNSSRLERSSFEGELHFLPRRQLDKSYAVSWSRKSSTSLQINMKSASNTSTGRGTVRCKI